MKVFHIIVLFFVLIPLTFAGVSIGSGGHHKSSHDVHIKGPIGDGYIYPVKNKHQQKGGGHSSGNKAQTYKLIIQNAGSHDGSSHHQQSQQQPTQVKTFKIIKQSSLASSSGHEHGQGNSVKTIKLIHVNGGSNGCSNSGQGWD